MIFTLNAAAQEIHDSVPSRSRWHLRTQIAGFQGLVSVGGGPVLAKGVWRPGLIYGYAPPAGERTAVHQMILRNDLILMPNARSRRLWASPTISANFLMETGTHSYLKLPDRFPAGYYHSPRIHGTLGLGARISRSMQGISKELSFGAEIVGLDTYMWYAISQRGIPIYEAFGFSFGLAAAF
ncbi:MAG: hypothetical protein M3R08_06815 [Bacteroidota bacterium]|nr:hypothetical protein [Bacteroidota bacterium]